MSDLLIRNATLVDGSGAPPVAADVRARDGRILAVARAGSLAAGRAEVVDAQERLLTPGFVDVHTHYDGQATWDPVLAPSAWHGVTTVVMGNCGVGFAPVRPGEQQALIELMEGVEDIPGSALADGIDWQWEGFPEYLDALERMPRTLDVAAQIPHGALRAYAMGERGARNEPARSDDLERMSALVREAIAAGAVAFSTNRMALHTSIHGEPVPGTFADAAELGALTRAVAAAGGRLVQSIPAGSMGEDPGAPLREVALYAELSIATGVGFTFSTPQVHPNPEQWREVLAASRAANAAGARLVPQVMGRPAGLLLSWDAFNPFQARPAYAEIAGLPPAERLRALAAPERRARILSESAHDDAGMAIMRHALHSAFVMDDEPVFEPPPEQSLGARAERAGLPWDALLYDTMCEIADAARDGGRARMVHVFFSGYAHGDLQALHEMICDDVTVVGLADGGAHCSMMCDASLPTFVLAHWVRDRTRGPRIPIERAVRLLCRDPADLYGLGDRGRIAPGLRADLNLIDPDAVALCLPEVAADLPTGASRIVQRGHGIVATWCAGEATFRAGEPTGARPGRLVRGAR